MTPRLFLKRTLVFGAAAGMLVMLARPATSQQADQDVLKVIPENYTLLYENALVRVIEARVPPGAEEKPPHARRQHLHDRVHGRIAYLARWRLGAI